ncbi:hypothetical protein U0070_012415, partial [Myodes glareolus]
MHCQELLVQYIFESEDDIVEAISKFVTREATQEEKHIRGEQIAQIVNVHVGSNAVIKNRSQGCSLLHSLAEANSSTKSAEIYDS